MSTRRPKPCLFCGLPFKVQKKSFEHVISRWLVAEADLRRRTTPVNLPRKTFSAAMGKIGGQSCDSCNNQASKLESKAKHAYWSLTRVVQASDLAFSGQPYVLGQCIMPTG